MAIDQNRAIEVLDRLIHFLEAAGHNRKRLLLSGPEKAMARDVAELFIDQGRDMVKELSQLEQRFEESGRLTEALSLGDWAYLIDNVLHRHGPPLESAIDTYTGEALLTGADQVLNDFGAAASIQFRAADPLAVNWAEGRAASQVTRIDNTTRQHLNTLLTRAVADGKSWTATAAEIEAMYARFAGPPLFPSMKFRSRAQAIAAFEIGDAYEAGSYFAAQKIEQATGEPLVKDWLTAGDDRVRPAHQANAADGSIALNEVFSGDGSIRPPSDPGCRCTLSFQKA